MKQKKINNLIASRQDISEDTYLANHPYIIDVEKEKEAIKEEMSEHPYIDKIPVKDGLNE